MPQQPTPPQAQSWGIVLWQKFGSCGIAEDAGG